MRQRIPTTSLSTLILTAVATVFASAGAGASLVAVQEAGSAGSADPARVKAGRALFAENCQPCHGSQGKGDGPAARFLDTKPHDLSSGVWEEARGGTVEAIVDVVTKGVDGTEMEPFDEILSAQEIADVAPFVYEVIAPKR